jgi:putative polyketide hydroxylase
MTPQTHIPVLIIGGGVVGLSASLFLSYHGIQSIVVERRSGTSIHPRARSVNARTMELFRRLEIEDLVREAGASISSSSGIYYTQETLKALIEAKPRSVGERKFPFSGLLAGLSPAIGTFVTQDMLEPVLVNAVRQRGDGDAAVKFSTECIGVEQDDTCVVATLRDREDGAISTIKSDYMIAADGAKSPIRTQLDVPITGQGTMGHLLNILFNADLKELVDHREFSLCVIERPEVCGLFTSINNSDRWVFHLSYDPSKGEKSSDYTPQKCKELLRIAIGMPDLHIDIQSILPWEPAVRLAQRLQHGRIFLAGDSASSMPPYAGQGANSGIASAHNLTWKLAIVMKGHASKLLLETYDVERFPVGLEAAEVSASGVDEKGLLPAKKNWNFVTSVLKKAPLVAGYGYGYTSKAICMENTYPLGGLSWRPWGVPSLFLSIDGRPGRRAPHVWVEHRGKRISTLDLFGKSFVLLAGADGTAWLDAAKQISAALSLDIDAYCVGPKADLIVSTGVFEAAAGISPRGAVLVRPDDFVAWRERRLPSDHRVKLEAALKEILCIS